MSKDLQLVPAETPPSDAVADPIDFLAGGGEMGERIGAFDWSNTPLGPIGLWPQSLKTSVSTSLGCAFPIVFFWGPELTVLYNDEYRPMLGAKHPGALGQPAAKAWAAIWDVIGPMLAQVMERGEATRSRDLMLHIDRHGYPEEAYFSFSYCPVQIESGRPGGVFCPVIETTEKVIGERRLRTLRDLAAACQGANSQQAVFQAVTSVLAANAHDVPFAIIYRIDDGQQSAQLESAVGIAPGSSAAQDSVRLLTESPETNQNWPLGSVVKTGKPAVVADLAARFDRLATGAWRVPPHTGIALPILLPGQARPSAVLVAAISPMRPLDADYRTFFELLATQITSGLAEARALEEERRRAEALAEIDRAKTAFFSNVSHEFRTPLTLMLGPLEDMLSRGHSELSPATKGQLEVVNRNGLRLLRLVNTLLDFSRIEAGRVRAAFQPTDLASFTADLASVFRSACERAGLKLSVDCPPLSEPVYVDRDMWEKIILNLLSNAFKFTFEGEIAVTLRQNDRHAELVVRDTGTGIPADQMPRVFERFHRISNARGRTHEGSGIGLALVQELVKLHGGTVRAESVYDQGTAFFVSIPFGCDHFPPEQIGGQRATASTTIGASPFVEEALRWLPDPPEDRGGEAVGPARSEAMPVPYRGATDMARPRVLIADDNGDMREYLARLLGERYHVEAVVDGAAGLAAARQCKPDLILTDVMMPRLDGFGLLSEVRADTALRDVPVLMLSARAGEESRIEGVEAGADDYLVKPFSARELLARVGAHLQMARMRRETEEVLRDADRRKDEFLAMLAHELRNPLAAIRNAVRILLCEGADGQSDRGASEILERQVGHMIRQVDDLLDVSRVSHGKIELRKELSELATVVNQVVEANRPLCENLRHELIVTLPRNPLHLNADPTRLAQVIGNLLNNACKFTNPGGQIWLTVEQNREEAVIRVRDTGIGIASDEIRRIFEIFAQVDRSLERARDGLGLGLALAKNLVEMHDGTIEARSEGLGTGSEFVVRLPLLSGPLPVQPLETVGVQPGPVVPRRVLLVEDNRDSARALAMLLKLMGHEVECAHDGLEAVGRARTFQADLILLDIGLPGLNGFEAARQIREQGQIGLTLVALTGWGQEEDRRRSKEAGFDAHLVKPVDLDALSKLLDDAGRG